MWPQTAPVCMYNGNSPAILDTEHEITDLIKDVTRISTVCNAGSVGRITVYFIFLFRTLLGSTLTSGCTNVNQI